MPKIPVIPAPFGAWFHAALVAALLAFGAYFDVAASADGSALPARGSTSRDQVSGAVAQLARWAVASRDHAGLPFVVIDKLQARLFAFDPEGRFRASAPVLLGSSRSDAAAVPATPAGRFVADVRVAAGSGTLVWVNAEAALSLHGVPSAQSPGHGMRRLSSPDAGDKRISDGSLHVAADFYREFLMPLRGQASIAYVLPETAPAERYFSTSFSPPRAFAPTRSSL